MAGATYRAYQAVGGGKLELVDRPVEEPAAGMVRVAVEACGICHTDVLTVEGGFPGMKYPRVPGHEAVGRIDALGAGVMRQDGPLASHGNRVHRAHQRPPRLAARQSGAFHHAAMALPGEHQGKSHRIAGRIREDLHRPDR
jgi:NADPH:quinone reductase-like Zn-dependent oxidoreductase